MSLREPEFHRDSSEVDPEVDADLLAGWVDGDLLPEEKRLVEAHLCTSDRDRRTTASLKENAPERRRLLSWITVAAAAFALGFVLWSLQSVKSSSEDSFDIVLGDLHASHAELFPSWSPIDGLLKSKERTIRSSGEGASPRGVILDSRPAFTWPEKTLEGIDEGLFDLRDAEGRSIWSERVRSSSLRYGGEMPLAPGVYRWTIADPDLPTDSLAFQSFEVFDRERWDLIRKTVDDEVSPDLRTALLAYVAVSHGLLDEARSLLGEGADSDLAKALHSAIEREIPITSEKANR